MSVLPYFLEQEVLGLFCLAKVLRSRGALIPFRGEWNWETKNWALYGSSLLLSCYSSHTLLEDTNRDCVCPCVWGFPLGTGGKEPACQCIRHKRYGFDPWVRKIPWRRKWQPLQYSCLENPMDRGALWATVRRVTKSQTLLKQFSVHAPQVHYLQFHFDTTWLNLVFSFL